MTAIRRHQQLVEGGIRKQRVKERHGEEMMDRRGGEKEELRERRKRIRVKDIQSNGE